MRNRTRDLCRAVCCAIVVAGASGHISNCSTALAAERQLAGAVVDPEGKPIQGAEVYFTPANPDGKVASAVTNSQGEFDLTLHPTKTAIYPWQIRAIFWRAVAAAMGFREPGEFDGRLWTLAPHHQFLMQDLEWPLKPPLRFVVPPAGDLHVQLLDAAGKPVVGAKLTVTRLDRTVERHGTVSRSIRIEPREPFLSHFRAESDARGFVDLPTLQWSELGNFELVHPTMGRVSCHCDYFDRPKRQIVQLPELGTVRGRLVADNAEVVRGVKLTVWTRSYRVGLDATSQQELTTDAEGKFESQVMVAGDASFDLGELANPQSATPKWLLDPIETQRLEAGRPFIVELPIKHTVRYHGRIRDASTGKPLALAPVAYHWTNAAGNGLRGGETTTDERGEFEFYELPGDIEYQLGATDNNKALGLVAMIGELSGIEALATAEYEVEAGGCRKFVSARAATGDFKLPTLDVVQLHGRVVDSAGNVKVGAVIGWKWEDAGSTFKHDNSNNLWPNEQALFSHGSGRFRFWAPADGTLQIEIVSAGCQPLHFADVQPSKLPGGLMADLVLWPPGGPVRSIAGRVVGRDGKPIAAATVFLAAHAVETTTDVDGKFRLNKVPLAIVPVFAEKGGFRFGGQWADAKASRIEIQSAKIDEKPIRELHWKEPDVSPARCARLTEQLLEPVIQRVLRSDAPEGSRASWNDFPLYQFVDAAPRRARELSNDPAIKPEYRKELHRVLKELALEHISGLLSIDGLQQIADSLALSDSESFSFSSSNIPTSAFADLRGASHLSYYLTDCCWTLFDAAPTPQTRAFMEFACPSHLKHEVLAENWLSWALQSDRPPEHRRAALLKTIEHARLLPEAVDRMRFYGWIAGALLDDVANDGRQQNELAGQLLHEGQALAATLHGNWAEHYCGEFAGQLARVELPAALDMVRDLRPAVHYRAMASMACSLAPTQPAEAEGLIAKLRAFGHARTDIDERTATVCATMASADLPRAKRIAAGIGDPSQRARAFGAMAVAVSAKQKPIADVLFREAFEILEAASKPGALAAPTKTTTGPPGTKDQVSLHLGAFTLTMTSSNQDSDETDERRLDRARRHLAFTGTQLLGDVSDAAPSLIDECTWRVLALRMPTPNEEDAGFSDSNEMDLPAWVNDEQSVALSLFACDATAGQFVVDSIWKQIPDRNRPIAYINAIWIDPNAVLRDLPRQKTNDLAVRFAAKTVESIWQVKGTEAAFHSRNLPEDSSWWPGHGNCFSVIYPYSSPGSEAPAPAAAPTAIALDGRFSENKKYMLGWKRTEGKAGFRETIQVNEFYYRTGATYAYFFFKCNPSLDDSFLDGQPSCGDFATLIVEPVPVPAVAKNSATATHDVAPHRQAVKIDVSMKNSVAATQDISIKLEGASSTPIDFFTHPVTYEAFAWDPDSETQGKLVREEGAALRHTLIGAGRDGVEFAVPLADLGLQAGQECELTCRAGRFDAKEDKPLNRLRIRVK